MKLQFIWKTKSNFTIIATNNSEKNIYIQSVTLNGKPYSRSYLKHSDIMKGGTMEFMMGEKPNKTWANSVKDRPYSLKYKDVTMPQISVKGKKIGRDGVVTFKGKSKISVICDMEDVQIFYTIDGSEPNNTSLAYKNEIEIDHSCILKVKAFKKGYEPSYTSSLRLRNLSPIPALKLRMQKKVFDMHIEKYPYVKK